MNTNKLKLKPKIKLNAKYLINDRLFKVIDLYFSDLHNMFTYKLIDEYNGILWLDEYTFFSEFYNFKKITK